MLERGSGVQINVDSLNTYAPLKGVAPYAMSKGGLSMMTRVLATEWGPRGVRVNGLAPGFILTDLTQKLWSDPTMQEWARFNTPLGRLGQVQDLVGAAVFLASDASAFMTGQVIYVDGGMSAGVRGAPRAARHGGRAVFCFGVAACGFRLAPAPRAPRPSPLIMERVQPTQETPRCPGRC
jgi:hypothetical protein